MSAIDEPRAAGSEAGKSIRPMTVDEATRAVLPQLAYADAIWARHRDLEMVPDALETGVRREALGGDQELFIRLEWLPGHDDLVHPAVRRDGLTVEWSHLAGWMVRSGADVHAPAVDKLAAPRAVGVLSMHGGLCRPGCTGAEQRAADRWEHAVYLEIALGHYAERTGGRIG
ncbi:hypothetical protein AB0G64_09275 [Streptomyces longwoodensis]|uniref:hypothetical protein n=1 Tax=Streptomyces longwoodensis TaxID=68231 RepID=UPI003400CE5E